MKVGSMGCVVRVSRWLEFNMEMVVRSQPAVFTVLTVMDRLVARVRDGEDSWCVVLDRLAVTLLEPSIEDSVRGYPLLVVAALHPTAHILAKEIVSKVDILSASKNSVLCVLRDNLDIIFPSLLSFLLFI